MELLQVYLQQDFQCGEQALRLQALQVQALQVQALQLQVNPNIWRM